MAFAEKKGQLRRHSFVLSLIWLSVLLFARFLAASDPSFTRTEVYIQFSLFFILILFSFLKNPVQLLCFDWLCALTAFTLSASLYVSYYVIVYMLPYSLPVSAVLFLLLSVFFYFLILSLKAFFFRPSPERASLQTVGTHHWVSLFLFYAMILTVTALSQFPYELTPDSLNQQQQIHGELRYNTVHAIGHTMFLKLLFRFCDSFLLPVLIQLIGILILYLLFSRFFHAKGIPMSRLALVFGAALILVPAASESAYFQPWKDTPSALCLCAVTYILLRYHDSGTLSTRSAAALGLFLAWTHLFRLNGIVALLGCGLYFTVSLLRRKFYRQTAVMLACIIASELFVSLYSERVLHPIEHPNGFSVQVFGSGLASMVNADVLSPEELAQVDEILDVEWMKTMYSRYERTRLIWTSDASPLISSDPELAIYNNEFILDLGAHRNEVIRLYFSLMPKHPIPCLKDIMGSLFMMWRVSTLFSVSFLFQFLLLIYLAIRQRLRLRDTLVFFPVLCNTVSIMISAVTSEPRYLLPFFMLLPVFLLYLQWKSTEHAVSSHS